MRRAALLKNTHENSNYAEFAFKNDPLCKYKIYYLHIEANCRRIIFYNMSVINQ